ncbi:MAG: hypothetical protein CSA61_01245 [Neptuniibacter caesariensis]|uniref:Prepilin-type N-terminal cleavage/methylation domain-containing protein n=1 Tax=Neptuniibacter caesariensis TaxID=207954 RepID=A0A2G6JDB8_NEPCE|nr:MAG: hypothetical protein CSA61_01245 [Neptuniibacter caesariensis]
MRRRCSGFSLLELVVSILVIAILMAVAYSKLEQMAEGVEQTSFSGVQDNIQAQLTLKVAYWYAEQQQVSEETLRYSNPLDWVQYRPLNYAGELVYTELSDADAEHWYFVKDKHWLVYKAKRISHLVNGFEQGDIIPFQVKVRFANAGQARGLAVEATLEELYPFDWQTEE